MAAHGIGVLVVDVTADTEVQQQYAGTIGNTPTVARVEASYVDFEEAPGRRVAGKLLTKDEARRLPPSR